MRNILAILSTCVIMSSSIAIGAEAQKMDESTNPNSNVNTKTQNLQQKPNADQPQATDKKGHHDKTTHEHKSNIDPASDDVNRDGVSNTEKLRQKPN